MKVYFTASMAGRDKYFENYRQIVSLLREMEIEVYEETLDVTKKYVYEGIADEEKVKYYRKVLRWLNEVDIVVVEASHSSLSIGHEISLSLERNRPVIVLYSEGNAPHYLVGVKSDKLLVQKYSLDNLKKVLKDAIEYASERRDTRFNFFISRKLVAYLDWISRKKRIPRAVYLRQLIRREMRKHSEFKKG